MPDINAKSYQCRHIFADGHRCGSKSIRQEEFCYYHHTTRKPAPRQDSSPNCSTFELAFPEDRTTIQTNISEVLRRIATNTVDVRRAGLLLYGLQIASLNLPKTQPGRNPEDDEFDDIIVEIIEHPTLGPLAPTAEFVHPDDQRPESMAQRLWRELEEENNEDSPINLQATAAPPNHPYDTLRLCPILCSFIAKGGVQSLKEGIDSELRYPSGVSSEELAEGPARPHSSPRQKQSCRTSALRGPRPLRGG